MRVSTRPRPAPHEAAIIVFKVTPPTLVRGRDSDRLSTSIPYPLSINPRHARRR
ncbi:hypothetical protein BC826DRAFT_1010869 [Russula brevipes]|nr:hypothetical protein BC826DRAFT_1055125 [Russula brevipes]KAI0294513.1 hypothetical protein BC826DRAFT_1010869 [Russula brevipes]